MIKPLVLPLDVVANKLHGTGITKNAMKHLRQEIHLLWSHAVHIQGRAPVVFCHTSSYQLLTDLGTELRIVISCLQGSEK